MTTLIKYCTHLIFLLASSTLLSQNYTAKVLSSETGEPIPYATIQLATNSGTITNEEGVFSIDHRLLSSLKDSITISSIGYKSIQILPKMAVDTVLLLSEKRNELENVFLTTKQLEPREIIDRVKENLDSNYSTQLTKQDLFWRTSYRNTVNNLDVEFKKSTIEELNKELIDSIVKQIPRRSDSYSESVGTVYGNFKDQKVNVVKAAELYDENADVTFEAFAERLEKIFMENVKPDSYLKIKSGWLSEKVQVAEILEGSTKKDTTQEIQKEHKVDSVNNDVTTGVKRDIHSLYGQLFFKENSKLDFLHKSNRYEFEQSGFTTIGNNIAYVINFEPKGAKDFKGTMYVNTDDFAVLKVDFKNIKRLYGIKLFGVGYRDITYSGTSHFTKNDQGSYALSFMELLRENVVVVDRPLTVIEKNKNVKGRRKQNELDLAINFKITTSTNTEFVVFKTNPITVGEYETYVDSEGIEATHLTAYDSKFWDGYAVIEPNAAIQKFKVGI